MMNKTTADSGMLLEMARTNAPNVIVRGMNIPTTSAYGTATAVASVDVTTPPRIVARMMTGMSRGITPALSAARIPTRFWRGAGGGLMDRALKKAMTASAPPSNSPGMAPEKSCGCPSRSIAAMNTGPSADASATAEPDIPAKMTDDRIATWHNPMQTWPTNALAMRMMRSAMPLSFISSPARMNSGIAMIGNESRPEKICCASSISGRPRWRIDRPHTMIVLNKTGRPMSRSPTSSSDIAQRVGSVYCGLADAEQI